MSSGRAPITTGRARMTSGRQAGEQPASIEEAQVRIEEAAGAHRGRRVSLGGIGDLDVQNMTTNRNAKVLILDHICFFVNNGILV